MPLQQTLVWEYESEDPVLHIAVAGAADTSLVATAARTMCVIDGAGNASGTFNSTYPVRVVRGDRRGHYFSALAGEVIYAFSAQGQFEWRVELDGDVSDFDVESTGESLAAVTLGGRLYVHNPQTHETRVATTGKSMTAVACVEEDEEPWFLVRDEKGRLALVDDHAVAAWEQDLAGSIGNVCASGIADLVAAPAGDGGVVMFALDGREKGSVEFEEPVVRLSMSPDGAALLAETAGGRLVQFTADGNITWEHDFGGDLTAWGMGLGGRFVVVAEDPLMVRAYRLRADESVPVRTTAPQSAPSADVEPQERDTEYMEVENIIDNTVTSVVEPPSERVRLLWKKKLPGDSAPSEPSGLALRLDGQYTALLLGGGQVMVLDRTGDKVVTARTSEPACILPPLPERAFAAVGVRDLVLLDPAAGTISMAPLGERFVKLFDCSADARLCCTIDDTDTLRAFNGGGKAVWQKRIDPEPLSLFVSPLGKMILVTDVEGRNRFFNAAGRLIRKFRFSGSDRREPLALADGYSVFGRADGHLVVLDGEGRPLWSEHLFSRIADLEVFGVTLAVYGESGACVVIDPLENLVWDFQPPEGMSRLRKPSRGDPSVVHATGNVVSVWTGYGRDLRLRWCYECDDEVSILKTDRQGRTVVALAGDKLYCLEPR